MSFDKRLKNVLGPFYFWPVFVCVVDGLDVAMLLRVVDAELLVEWLEFNAVPLARRVNVPVDKRVFALMLDVAVTPRANALPTDWLTLPTERFPIPETARRTSDNFDTDGFDWLVLVDPIDDADDTFERTDESFFAGIFPKLGRRKPIDGVVRAEQRRKWWNFQSFYYM